MTNTERFLSAFNKIEQFLREEYGFADRYSFTRMVGEVSQKGSQLIHVKESTLKKYAKLRNTIVHESIDGKTIAEPHDEVVEEIEKIAQSLLEPPKVFPKFSQNVFSLTVTDSLGEAVKAIYNHDYSQIPIYNNEGKFQKLLTANTISRWLGASVDEEIFSLQETTIEDVLEFTEDPDIVHFCDRNQTLYDILDIFQQYEIRGKRLEAILITQNGSESETPIGIVTVWDLATIYQELE